MAPSNPAFKRYAVYFVPQGTDLARFGANWLGWDITEGEVVPHPDFPNLGPSSPAELTQTPRRYGFHATIVPPFRLDPDHEIASLQSLLRGTVRSCAPVTLDGLELAALGRFLALVPEGAASTLNALASALVEQTDVLRAAISEDDLARHRAKGLTPAQDALLVRWGYPYVKEAFKFHMTLTSKLPKAQVKDVKEALDPHLTPILPKPFVIRQLALVGEDQDGWFHLIEQFDLTGSA